MARRLGRFATLNAEEIRLIASLKPREVGPNVVLDPSALALDSCLILSGWCGRLGDMKARPKSVISVLLPGDGFGLGASSWAGAALPVRTLTSCVLLEASPITQIVRFRSPAYSRLISACERAAWFEQVYAIHHTTRLSSLNAYERVAHFLLEVYVRLTQVELAPCDRFAVPINQQIVADILGISGIHFNRTVRQMRRDGVIAADRGAIQVLDSVKLSAAAGTSGAAFCAGAMAAVEGT